MKPSMTPKNRRQLLQMLGGSIAAFWLAACTRTTAPGGERAMLDQTEFQTLIDQQIGRDGVQNIIAGVRSHDRRIDLAAAAGFVDADATIPMTPTTAFPLASITKMYTATAIMQLHAQGALDLDAHVSEYLPADLLTGIHTYRGVDYSRELRVYHLVSQTSGLADYFEDKPSGGQSLFDEIKAGRDQSVDVARAMEIVRGLSPKFAPGRKAHYADTNYILLGAIIESVTDQPLTTVYREQIFAPLGLEATYAYADAAAYPHLTPAAIWFKDRVLDLPLFLASHTADGGLISTLDESQRFLQAFFEGKLFDATLLARMTAQWQGIFFPLQYGYGVMRFKMPRFLSPFHPPQELLGHSGSTGAFAFYAPAHQLYLTGTVNQVATPSKPFQLMLQWINALI